MNARWESPAPQRRGCPAAGDDKEGDEGGQCTQGPAVISGVLRVLLTLDAMGLHWGLCPVMLNSEGPRKGRGARAGAQGSVCQLPVQGQADVYILSLKLTHK